MRLEKNSPNYVFANLVWMLSLFLIFMVGLTATPIKEITKTMQTKKEKKINVIKERLFETKIRRVISH